MKAIYTLFLLVLISCGPTPKDEKLEEAANIHNEAIAVSGKVSEMLASVESQLDSLSDDQKATFNQLSEKFEEWRDLVVEVPGYEHEEHDHAHGHDHDHGPNELEGLPSDQILEIQKELKRQIVSLLQEAEQFIKEQNPG